VDPDPGGPKTWGSGGSGFGSGSGTLLQRRHPLDSLRIYLLLELGPVSVEEDEEAEAEGEDEEGVPGQEQEEGLQHPQEHRHVDVALRQLRVHAHLCKINQGLHDNNKK
jgi:hypothetical protein